MVVRIIVLIKPNTTGSPLDEVVHTTQLSAFCLATEKPQVVVQLSTPRILRDNMRVPIARDPPPAVLFGFRFHPSALLRQYPRLEWGNLDERGIFRSWWCSEYGIVKL